ncbi:alpha/beta hydrolase [Fervidobacterium thailandense]|uniref:Lysophospholipase n=1 Tax=Fervidobacterium thailandense TaxID=1008305 RepID=A0A1E3G4Q2_9BACT|nr:alpha/beta hydrolase [Fervidobacterium thailandense]ODN31266.1 lysophospholipase [Fervidobacterium thailandense]
MLYSFKRGEPARGYVVLVHGLGEHSGRYEPLIEKIGASGLSVIGFDLPGHGKSGGRRGDTSVEEVIRVIDELTRGIERFRLFGHSLGGLIAIRYAQERPQRVEKLVVSSPALMVKPAVFQRILLTLLSGIAPFVTFDNGINAGMLSRSKEAVEKYLSDPLVHDRISIRLGRSLLKNVDKAHQYAEKIVCPVTLLIGTADVITPPEGARLFYERLRTQRKKMLEFPGGYHELFEDPQHAVNFKEAVVSELLEI